MFVVADRASSFAVPANRISPTSAKWWNFSSSALPSSPTHPTKVPAQMFRFRSKKPERASLHYVGICGATSSCVDGVLRYVQYGDKLGSAALLTHSCEHAFLLTINNGEQVAVKSGFTSGYRGTGPRGLAFVLTVLERHGCEIEEFLVGRDFLNRLNTTSLLESDLDYIQRANPVRPLNWHEYVFAVDPEYKNHYGRIRSHYPEVMPFGLIDQRVEDLAIEFFDDQDRAISIGYRRLEDVVRRRTGVESVSGVKLFSKAFNGEDSILTWDTVDPAEQKGMAALFSGAWMAFRNNRAHREKPSRNSSPLREFYLLNELFVLESKAKRRDGQEPKEETIFEQLLREAKSIDG